MTIQPHGSNAAALPEGFDDGLGDFDETDAAVPRLTIVHKEAVFKESLSGVKYEALDLIILGLVKQRTLWSTDVDEGEKPLCKSPDFENGFPTDVTGPKAFPWGKTPFDAQDYRSNDGLQVVLPCNQCPLKEWKSHPNGKTPWCSEEFTLPVLYDATGDGDYMPAILTIKKSGLKNLKSFLASFQRTKMPAFSVVTRVTLRAESRGQTDYAVPEWAAGNKTEGEDWEGFSATYKGLREFLRQFPSVYDDDGNRVERDTDNAPQQAAPAAAQTAPVAAPQQTRARPSQPASTAPVATPAPQPEEDVQEAEIIEDEPAPAPAAKSTAPQPAAAATDDDDDELPF